MFHGATVKSFVHKDDLTFNFNILHSWRVLPDQNVRTRAGFWLLLKWCFLTFDDFPLVVQVRLHDTQRWIHLLFVLKWRAPKGSKKTCLVQFYIFSVGLEDISFSFLPRGLARCGRGGPVSETNLISLAANKTPMWKAFFRLPKNTILNRGCKLELDFWPIPLESKIKHAVRSSFASKKNNSGSFHRFKASGDHREHYGMQVT